MDAPVKIVPSLAPLPGPFDGYPGGKGSPGVYQTIINHIPLHARYYETCVGSGAIYRRKRPAYWNFIGDIDRNVCEKWDQVLIENPEMRENTGIHCGDLIDQLDKGIKDKSAFVFIDPPYLGSVRSSERDIYPYEIKTEEAHIRILKFITQDFYVHAKVMICGYYSELYADYLRDWKMHKYQGWSRQGPTEEVIWMNYDISHHKLHDYRYIGEDKRKREDARQKVRRWVKGLDRMDRREREAIIFAIKEAEPCWRAS